MRHIWKSILLLTFFVLFSPPNSVASDQGMRGEQSSIPDASKKNFIIANGKKYSASMAGLDAFMADLKKSEPDLYSKLRPEYENIKSARLWHQILGWSFAIGGTALMMAAPEIAPDERGSSTKPSTPLVIAGGVGLIGGITLLFLTPPSANRVEEFKDLHNKYEPNRPMRFSIFATDSAVGGLAQFSF